MAAALFLFFLPLSTVSSHSLNTLKDPQSVSNFRKFLVEVPTSLVGVVGIGLGLLVVARAWLPEAIL